MDSVILSKAELHTDGSTKCADVLQKTPAEPLTNSKGVASDLLKPKHIHAFQSCFCTEAHITCLLTDSDVRRAFVPYLVVRAVAMVLFNVDNQQRHLYSQCAKYAISFCDSTIVTQISISQELSYSKRIHNSSLAYIRTNIECLLQKAH